MLPPHKQLVVLFIRFVTCKVVSLLRGSLAICVQRALINTVCIFKSEHCEILRVVIELEVLVPDESNVAAHNMVL